MDDQLESRKDTIRALMEGTRQVLGDAFNDDQGMMARRLLNRQCEHLIALDPGYAEALREIILERTTTLFPDAEIREKVLTDQCDPFHIYWLLTAPDYSIKHFGRHRADGDGKPTGLAGLMAGLIGPFRIEPTDEQEER